MSATSDRTTAAALRGIIKSASATGRRGLAGAWIDAAGRQCVCDGFRAVRLARPVAGLPETDAAAAIDLDKVYPGDDFAGYTAVTLPAADALKTFLAAVRRGEISGDNPTAWPLGVDDAGRVLPAVNAAYLLDIVRALPGAAAYARDAVSALYFSSDAGDALLLPLRMDPERARARRAEIAAVLAAAPEDKRPALGLRAFAALYAPAI